MNNTTSLYTDVAQRIYDITEPWERDILEWDVNNIAEKIQNDPLPALRYLLGIIERSTK